MDEAELPPQWRLISAWLALPWSTLREWECRYASAEDYIGPLPPRPDEREAVNSRIALKSTTVPVIAERARALTATASAADIGLARQGLATAVLDSVDGT